MNIGGALRHLPAPLAHAAVGIINSVPPLRRWVSRTMINHFAYLAPSRPRAISMAGDYAHWEGLTNRTYSGRHLPPPKPEDRPDHPDTAKVVELFMRPARDGADLLGYMVPSHDTSLLFPYFAQWFTDSFLRTKWEPDGEKRRFRHNESNHEIDLIQIYGTGAAQTEMLKDPHAPHKLRTSRFDGSSEIWPGRLFEKNEHGRLELAADFKPNQNHPGLYSEGNFQRVYHPTHLPVWTEQEKGLAFTVGLEHGNSTLGNAAMNCLFIREHNRVAELIRQEYGDRKHWDSERVFQTTRNILTVELLNIVIGDYIRHIAPIDFRLEAVPGMAEREHWYRPNWMTVEFALLYRWHDLVPDKFTLRHVDGAYERYGSDRMRQANQLLIQYGLGEVLHRASTEPAGRMQLHNSAIWLARIVKPLSVEMGRACNLASYNAYRRHYGLKPYSSFLELTGNEATAAELRELYGDIERLEWFVGIFAEQYGQRQIMGDLMLAMVANDAFTQALTNPLLAKAVYSPETFTQLGLDIIDRNRTLADVIAANTGRPASEFSFNYRQVRWKS